MRDITQKDLATALGFRCVQQVSNIERAKNSVPVKNIHALAVEFNINAEDIVDEMVKDEREYFMSELNQQRRVLIESMPMELI